jgi:hypothetical protein
MSLQPNGSFLIKEASFPYSFINPPKWVWFVSFTLIVISVSFAYKCILKLLIVGAKLMGK